MNSHLRPYNRCISNISTNIYLGLDFIKKVCNCIQLAYNGYVYRMIMAKEILKEHRRVKDFR